MTRQKSHDTTGLDAQVINCPLANHASAGAPAEGISSSVRDTIAAEFKRITPVVLEGVCAEIHRFLRELQAGEQKRLLMLSAQSRTVSGRNLVLDGQGSGGADSFERNARADGCGRGDDDLDDHEWMQRPHYSHFFRVTAKEHESSELTMLGTPKNRASSCTNPSLFHRPQLSRRASRRMSNFFHWGSNGAPSSEVIVGSTTPSPYRAGRRDGPAISTPMGDGPALLHVQPICTSPCIGTSPMSLYSASPAASSSLEDSSCRGEEKSTPTGSPLSSGGSLARVGVEDAEDLLRAAAMVVSASANTSSVAVTSPRGGAEAAETAAWRFERSQSRGRHENGTRGASVVSDSMVTEASVTEASQAGQSDRSDDSSESIGGPATRTATLDSEHSVFSGYARSTNCHSRRGSHASIDDLQEPATGNSHSRRDTSIDSVQEPKAGSARASPRRPLAPASLVPPSSPGLRQRSRERSSSNPNVRFVKAPGGKAQLDREDAALLHGRHDAEQARERPLQPFLDNGALVKIPVRFDEGANRRTQGGEEAWMPSRQTTETRLQARFRRGRENPIEISTTPQSAQDSPLKSLNPPSSRISWAEQVQSRCRCLRCCRFRTPRSVSALVRSELFDYSIGCLVGLNAVMIGFQADHEVRHLGEEDPAFFQPIEIVFMIAFAGELVLRFMTYGCQFFIGEAWRWNIFDTVVVLEQFFSLVLVALNHDGAKTSGMDAMNFSFMRILRAFRLIRIIRLIRILRLIRELRTIVDSIANTVRSLLWTLVLLFVMLYVVGVHYTQLMAEHARDHPELLENGSELKKWYGSLFRSVLSLYEAMTGGVDWDVLVVPLIEEISPLHGFVFSLFIAVAVLAMMNIITGLFVDSALKNTKLATDIDMVNGMRGLFKTIDFGDTGQVTWTEFEKQLDNPQMELYFKAVDLDISEGKGLFKLLDLDENGTISADEFVMGCLRLRGPAKAIDLATLMYENRRSRNHARNQIDEVLDLLGALAEMLSLSSSTLLLPLESSNNHFAAPTHCELPSFAKRACGPHSLDGGPGGDPAKGDYVAHSCVFKPSPPSMAAGMPPRGPAGSYSAKRIHDSNNRSATH